MMSTRLSQFSVVSCPRSAGILARTRSVAAHAENDSRRASAEESKSNEAAKDWEEIDDRIREQLYTEEWQDSLPLPFIAAVSTFGAALTGAGHTRAPP
jgi:hypothetical protein